MPEQVLDGDYDDYTDAEEELQCLFEMYAVRALRLLKRPHVLRATLALAHELRSRGEVLADEATALIQQHLASA
jgi:hypothetical protein